MPTYVFAMARVNTTLIVGSQVSPTPSQRARYTERMLAQRLYATPFAKVYPYYVAKAEKKGRTRAEVDELICWLTGYTKKGLAAQLKKQTDFKTFYAKAPKMNPSRSLITGVVCGIRVEEIKDPLMQEIRYLDKIIDELAKGKAMEKIKR